MNVKGPKQLLKPLLSKLNFAVGRNPLILKGFDKEKFIPSPYRSVVLISADFELAWAPRYDKFKPDALGFALEKARVERANFPLIIQCCEKYNIPVTWATVGHLFLHSCLPHKGKKHPEIPAIQNYTGPYWDFKGEDWFEYDPCTDVFRDPEWYAPDLIKQITGSPVKHEIACHTFSHMDCRDDICEPEVFRADVRECKRLASEQGIEMKSFVHPGHTIGNLEVLAEEGFTNFRTDYRNVLGYPKKHGNGLWELEQTREFRYYDYWSIDYQVYRYREIIKRAIKSNTVCVFWFHPSFNPLVVNEIWPEVFRYLDENRDKIWITTHSEYFSWLEKHGNRA